MGFGPLTRWDEGLTLTVTLIGTTHYPAACAIPPDCGHWMDCRWLPKEDDIGYDEFDSIIVAAPTEQAMTPNV
ncbi:hypothetical protein SPFM20_00001 [Salmonella phage SPFM20]|nr:hypothetical protein SPFM8_00295 [Salmonella phage SPFM8]VFR14492.1 hypothetical protein SPFM20_00001 [Salmonella phage SPFM20]